MPEKSRPPLFSRRNVFILLALLYVVGAGLSARHIIARTQASTQAIEQILERYSMQNEGAQALQQFDKEHPILGLFSGPVRKTLKLPSQEQSDEALYSDVPHLLKSVRQKSSGAAWWSWYLLSLSLFYVVTIIAFERSHNTRPVLFALTTISVVFFFIGILAPAMVIWTAPSIPWQGGTLNFVVQHQVRGIAAIIWELLTTNHWIIGGFLLLFSILTPLTKASLSYFVTMSQSKALNYKIGEFIHTIGKWSMADVFVAAVLLALYALKAQEATKSIPCLGLYYFIGYCLLSLTTTELLVRSGVVGGNDEKKSSGKLGAKVIIGLFAGLLCFVLGSSLYTFQQYTANLEKHLAPSDAPRKLNNADLVMPVHKSN